MMVINTHGTPSFNPEERFPEPEDILTRCPGLIATEIRTEMQPGDSILEATKQIVCWRLAHYSVKEYLVSERIRGQPCRRYAIKELDAHRCIAENCIAYLLPFDRPDSLTGENFSNFR